MCFEFEALYWAKLAEEEEKKKQEAAKKMSEQSWAPVKPVHEEDPLPA